MLLIEFDIEYIPRKAIKGQALTDFLARHLVPDDTPLDTELPDEEIMTVERAPKEDWELYFDRSFRTKKATNGPITRARVGVVFFTPQRGIIHFSCALIEERTNNQSEYEAQIIGLEIAIERGIT